MKHDCERGLVCLALCLLAAGITWADGGPRAGFLFEVTGSKQMPFNQPTDISIRGGTLYVVDGMNHRVVAFDVGGRYLFEFGDQEEMKRPVGMCTDSDGLIYVADPLTARVNIYSSAGKLVSAFTVAPVKDDKSPDITDCAVSGSGEIFLVDNDNHRVQVYSREGKRLRWWGEFGEGESAFRYPATVAADAAGKIYVVDVMNSIVKKFEPSGGPPVMIGDWGITAGRLFRPKGIMIRDDQVFVSDSYTGTIQVFDTEGAFKGVIAGRKGGALRFKTPTNMASSGSTLFVVEQLANRVSAWGLEEDSVPANP